jgi:hypothetical protein
MREQKSFTIAGHEKQITVRELTVRQIIEFLDPKRIEGLDFLSFFRSAGTDVLPRVTNLTMDEILEFAPSELDQIWAHFREVNRVFFGLPERLGIKAIAQDLRPTIVASFGALCVDWLARAMGKPSITDTPGSLTQSTSSESSNLSESSTLPGP